MMNFLYDFIIFGYLKVINAVIRRHLDFDKTTDAKTRRK